VYSAVLKSVVTIVKVSMSVVIPAEALNVPSPVFIPYLSTCNGVCGFVVPTPTLESV